MLMPSQLCHAVLAVALAVPCLAFAQSGAVTTRLSQFSYELVDLDLDDGISPAVQFVLKSHSLRSAYASNTHLVDEDVGTEMGTTAIAGPSGSAGSSLSTDTWFSHATTRFGPSDYEFYSAYAFTTWSYTLTPGTALSLRVLAEHTRNPAPEVDLYVDARLTGRLYGSDGGWLGSIDHYYWGEDESGFSWLEGTVASGTGTATGELVLGVASYAYTSPAAVPEPATGLMSLAGLGVVFAVARRRKACQADR